MYGILYAVSPEIFPAKDRGTGNGLTVTATRVFGVLVSSPLGVFNRELTRRAGADHRALRERRDGRASVRLRCATFWCGRACAALAV